jgi:hypothetical protein
VLYLLEISLAEDVKKPRKPCGERGFFVGMTRYAGMRVF